MRLSEAIAHLQATLKKHGDVDVYFDCPKCGSSFAPNRVVATATHFSTSTDAQKGDGE